MKRVPAVLSGVLLAGLLAACGSASSLPDPAPCQSPSPLPTSAAAPRITEGRAYFTALQDQLTQLEDLETTFKLTNPTNAFPSNSTFRPAVAKFIDDSTCVAQSLKSLEPPTAQSSTNKSTLDDALDSYIAHLQAGRAAILARNVTDYRTFWNGLDAKFDAVRYAASMPAQRGR